MPRRDFLMISERIEKGYPIIKELAAKSWSLGIGDIYFNNFVFAVAHHGSRKRPEEIPLDPEDRIKAGIPDFYAGISIFAPNDELLELHEKVIKQVVVKGGAQLVPWEDVLSSMPLDERGELPTFTNLPTQTIAFTFSSKGGGAISWVGAFLSSKDVVAFYHVCNKVLKKYNKHNLFYGRILSHGHHTYARAIVVSNKNDEKDLELMRTMFSELDEEIRKNIKSAARYHLSPWASRSNLTRLHGTTLAFLKKIKAFLDPNDVMNPGHFLDTT